MEFSCHNNIIVEDVSCILRLIVAFDIVNRDGLWKIMSKFWCPENFINFVRLFHDDMEARVKNNGEFSEPFPVINGVKQGCVLLQPFSA